MKIFKILVIVLILCFQPKRLKARDMCEDLFKENIFLRLKQKVRPEVKFDQGIYLKSVEQFQEQTSDKLMKFEPQTPEEKLAWLITLSDRATKQAMVGSEISLPAKRSNVKKLLRILNTEKSAMTPFKVDKLTKLLGEERAGYFEVGKLLLQGKIESLDNLFISKKLAADIRYEGVTSALITVGFLDTEAAKIKFHQKIHEFLPQIQIAIDSLGFVGGVSSLAYAHSLAGGAVPVYEFVRLKSLPLELLEKIMNNGLDEALPDLRKHYGIKSSVEASNWFLSKTVMQITKLILLAMLADEFLKHLGINMKDYWDNFITDKSALINADLDIQEREAKEQGFQIDRDAASRDLQKLSIEQIKLRLEH